MSEPTWIDIREKIEKGILYAQTEYKEATYTPLCYCPEYLMTVNIFKALLKLTYLSLEDKPDSLLKDYQQKPFPPHRPPIVPRGEGHVDIVLWGKDIDRPRAIIEVKRCATDWMKDSSDIKRLSGLLRKYQWLEFGVLAGCIHEPVKQSNKSKAKENIENNFKDIQKAVENSLSNSYLGVEPVLCNTKPLFLKKGYPQDKKLENWYWTPAIYKIYLKK